MSKSEIILTILALILCCWCMIKYTIPALVEWLEAMNTDETIDGKEGKDE